MKYLIVIENSKLLLRHCLNHIDPVTPINMTQKELGYEKIKERMWCDIENTQIMCKECHKKKSDIERAERTAYRAEKARQDGKPK